MTIIFRVIIRRSQDSIFLVVSDFVGTNNPHHIIYVDYYGDVYAKYVFPYVNFIAHSIWVPKTLVANKRGPIETWVPKSKQ